MGHSELVLTFQAIYFWLKITKLSKSFCKAYFKLFPLQQRKKMKTLFALQERSATQWYSC